MKRLATYTFSKEEKEALKDYLLGKKSTRQIAPILKCTHTQVINIVAKLAQEVYQKKEFIF